MKLDQLRYFVKIVECQSFNQAAKQLYMTQPALTKSLQALEDELHAVLLHRTKNGTYPTEFGIQIYNDCKEILDTLEYKIAHWKKLTAFKEEPSGTIHLASIPAISDTIFSEIIEDLKIAFPRINIQVHDIAMLDFSNELIQNHFNLGITSLLTEQLEHAIEHYRARNLNYKILLDDEYCIYMSTQNILAKKDNLTLEDCRQLSYITYSSKTDEKNALTKYIQTIFTNINQYQNNLGNIFQAIAHNKGITLFLKKPLQKNWYIENGFICTKTIKDEKILPNHHVLVYSSLDSLSQAETAVKDYIIDNYTRYFSN